MPEQQEEQFDKAKFDDIWFQYEKAAQADEQPLLIEESSEIGPESELAESSRLDEHLAEEVAYLNSVIEEYERFVLNIGKLKYGAPMLLYYRDEIQESLDFLKRYSEKLDLRDYWKKTVELDAVLRSKTVMYVKEVGYNNFKQYQIINDPPKLHWWWYLNRQTSAPPSENKWWEVWK